MEKLELVVVCPVYNEEVSIEKVVHEWLPALQKLNIRFKIYLLNDGSRDNTQAKLLALKNQFSLNIEVFEHANRGHGQTCIRGYQLALEQGAEWIMQIDSDGQCDPQFFQSLWQERANHPALFGYRVSRDDGNIRWWISRIVSIVVFIATFTWVKDANVPYRLIHHSILKNIVSQVPSDFYLANILVTALVQKQRPIKWLPIHFRDRFGGSPSVKAGQFSKHGWKLFRQLWSL